MTITSHLGFSLAGGVLIGLASFIASAATGKIPGLSGVLSRSFQGQPGDRRWRVAMLIGLVAGSGLVFALAGSSLPYRPVDGPWLTLLAGLLVGFGTRVGGGCTSGQGVCGIGLGARDALVATLVFMVAAMLVVYFTHHAFGVRV
jgi:uncharacterized membrane protein YedE/YeeE